MTDNSLSRDNTCNTLSVPTISDYDDLEQNTDCRITPETNLNVSALVLSEAYKSSHQRCSVTKGVLTNFAKFTGKHLCQSLFFDKLARLNPCNFILKRLWYSCFTVNFANFLRTPSVTEHLWMTASEPNSMKDLLC